MKTKRGEIVGPELDALSRFQTETGLTGDALHAAFEATQRDAVSPDGSPSNETIVHVEKIPGYAWPFPYTRSRMPL